MIDIAFKLDQPLLAFVVGRFHRFNRERVSEADGQALCCLVIPGFLPGGVVNDDVRYFKAGHVKGFAGGGAGDHLIFIVGSNFFEWIMGDPVTYQVGVNFIGDNPLAVTATDLDHF